MNAIFLLMVCGVLAGIPAALLVLATDPRFCGDDGDDDDEDEWLYCSRKPEQRAERVLQSELTQSELYAYMVGEVTP